MDATMAASLNQLVSQLENLPMPSGLSWSEVLGIGMQGLDMAAVQGDLKPFRSMASELPGDSLQAFFSVRNKYGLTTLHMAAMGGRNNVIKFLLKKGKVDIDIKDKKAGHTALHTAIMLRRIPTAEYLLEKGASPNAETQRRRTPLHYAAEFGNRKLIRMLITKGAEVDVVADCGTPLQVAARNGKEDFVKVLLENHANPNVMSHDLLSPLLESICTGSNECMKILLKGGADPNIRGSKGMTSLGWAASEGEAGVIKCLLHVGADPNVTDNLGMTPIEVAALRGSHENVMVLFPVTSPILKTPEWSIEGIMKHVQSDEARAERKQKSKEHILLSMAKGADCFKRKDYFGAAQHYSEAIRYDPTDAILLSKRSLCWARLNEGELAMVDAHACMLQRPNWPKAYLRVGAAWMVLKEFDKAAAAFHAGLKLDRKNEDLECAFREAIEAQRSEPVCEFGPESLAAFRH